MKAELKRVHSPDIPDLSSHCFDNGESFCFLLQALVGPEGGNGEESFDIEICTPKWLLENHGKHDVVFGRHRLIVFEYSYNLIINTIEKFIDSCSGNSWEEVAEKIGRLGKWEFEDYSDFHEINQTDKNK